LTHISFFKELKFVIISWRDQNFIFILGAGINMKNDHVKIPIYPRF